MSLRIHKIDKRFGNGKIALHNINIHIGEGEMVALIGASGSGKSTLLRLIAGLLSSDTGVDSFIEFNGRTIQMNGQIARDVRTTRSEIGFIFQQFNLVDRLTVLVNVLAGRLHSMPIWRGLLQWFNLNERAIALDALQRVGILECYHQRASTLSGGQAACCYCTHFSSRC
jgi:phosphonate transport system ATP-binding protein